LDAIGGASVFTSFGSGPLEISDSGDVLWYGDWDDANTDIDTGLFLNDELLVQEGTTEIDFLFVDTLRGVEDGYHMSNNGHYIIFEAILEDGSEGAFLITLPAADCEGDANGDGVVDPLDSGFVLARFGCPVGTGDPSCDAADQNGDGVVDPLDSGFVLARFGVCP
ncbi:MAG: hypothetical protein IID37_05955, partial [Planctomycetes bacterium]|nr:hypothetical protein [Planctomycetota bacterium]